MKQSRFYAKALILWTLTACANSETGNEIHDTTTNKTDAGQTLSDPAAYGEACKTDADCASKQCFENVCTKPCKSMSDCPSYMGKGFDCGEVEPQKIICYPRKYLTVPYTQGHNCSVDGKCAVGYQCIGVKGDADRYCSSTCTEDRDCPPQFRCAATRIGKEVNNDKLCLKRQFCHPCVIDDQCGGSDDLCVKDINGNGYCSKACNKNNPGTCPPYTKCEDAGNNTFQCRHKAGYCYKNFKSESDQCEPCIVHGWFDDQFNTFSEENVCKKEGICLLLDRWTGEGACAMPCGTDYKCPPNFGCLKAQDLLGMDVCLPAKTDPDTGQPTIDTCFP